jgi:hypothetical protein
VTRTPPLDLGHSHTLKWLSWSPDRDLNPQYADQPDIERAGAIIDHIRADGSQCDGGVIHFDLPGVREIVPNRAVWTVESWEPLTLSPSLLCHCGDHGFIRDGRWVPA